MNFEIIFQKHKILDKLYECDPAIHSECCFWTTNYYDCSVEPWQPLPPGSGSTGGNVCQVYEQVCI